MAGEQTNAEQSKTVEVKYLRKIRTPAALAGEVGQTRKLPRSLAREAISLGYLEEVAASKPDASKPNGKPDSDKGGKS